MKHFLPLLFLASCAPKFIHIPTREELAFRYSAGVLSLPAGEPLSLKELELHGLIEDYLMAHAGKVIPRDPAARYDHFIEWLNSTHRY